MVAPRVAGMVLAGGAARRLGGIDKPALPVDGVTLLDRVLAAARPLCESLVVVGPRRPTTVPGVVTVAERFPGGGPVPAISAGMAELGAATVVLVLAADLPLVTTAALDLLVDKMAGGPAAAASDDRGRPVPLLAAYRVGFLSDRLAELGPELAGVAARRLLPGDTRLVDIGEAGLNVNTEADLARARAAVAGPP
ncbi:MAG: molybdenum cofactor guanylyltransferase [Acidimicrobiales bacterium]